MKSFTDPSEVACLFKDKAPEDWQYICILTGFVPPETETEYHEAKLRHPRVMQMEARVAALHAIAKAASMSRRPALTPWVP